MSAIWEEAGRDDSFWLFMDNLVPRVLSYSPYGTIQRKTLVNASHVAPEQN